MIAHIDSGANVYHREFRDGSPLGQMHPCTYIAGFPCSAEAIHLTFDDTKTAEELRAIDAAEWAKVQRSGPANARLYWFPGTKVVGAVSFGSGGTDCPYVRTTVETFTGMGELVPTPPPTGTLQSVACPERVVLDEHGHGTMTASRMGGNTASMCAAMASRPEACRVVIIEGLGAGSTRWAAQQGWIDVQTNSWLSLVPSPVDALTSPNGVTAAFAYAQDRMLTFAASGNGAAYLMGFAPTPTYVLSTAAPGVILVGAHDNGHVTPWSGAPAHVVADGYGGLRASNTHTAAIDAHPMSCCTSAASPYAAGGGAAIVLRAREILGDGGTGLRTMPNGDQAIAVGPNAPASGLLAKGYLTLDEARDLLYHTATEKPGSGSADPNDGLLHWLGEGRNPALDPHVAQWGLGANPFCQGCVTLPVAWKDVSAPAHPDIGYGAVDPTSVALAFAVLADETTMPARPEVDAFFETDRELRRTLVMGQAP